MFDWSYSMILIIEIKILKMFLKTIWQLRVSSLKKIMYPSCVMFNTGTMLQANSLIFLTNHVKYATLINKSQINKYVAIYHILVDIESGPCKTFGLKYKLSYGKYIKKKYNHSLIHLLIKLYFCHFICTLLRHRVAIVFRKVSEIADRRRWVPNVSSRHISERLCRRRVCIARHMSSPRTRYRLHCIYRRSYTPLARHCHPVNIRKFNSRKTDCVSSGRSFDWVWVFPPIFWSLSKTWSLIRERTPPLISVHDVSVSLMMSTVVVETVFKKSVFKHNELIQGKGFNDYLCKPDMLRHKQPY